MFGNGAFVNLRQQFERQFEPDGDHFVYRRYMKGPPVQVSATERDAFVRAFDQFIRFGRWGIYCGTSVLAGGVVTYSMVNGQDVSKVAIWVGLGILLAVYMAAFRRAWDRPKWALRGRRSIGKARSRGEMRALFLARQTYRELAGMAALAAGFLIMVGLSGKPFVGWNIYWLAMAAILMLATAIQTVRKWRSDRANKK